MSLCRVADVKKLPIHRCSAFKLTYSGPSSRLFSHTRARRRGRRRICHFLSRIYSIRPNPLFQTNSCVLYLGENWNYKVPVRPS